MLCHSDGHSLGHMGRVPKQSSGKNDRPQIAAEKDSANDGLCHRTPCTRSGLLTKRSADSSAAEGTTAANGSVGRLVRLIARQAAGDFLKDLANRSKE